MLQRTVSSKNKQANVATSNNELLATSGGAIYWTFVYASAVIYHTSLIIEDPISSSSQFSFCSPRPPKSYTLAALEGSSLNLPSYDEYPEAHRMNTMRPMKARLFIPGPHYNTITMVTTDTSTPMLVKTHAIVNVAIILTAMLPSAAAAEWIIA